MMQHGYMPYPAQAYHPPQNQHGQPNHQHQPYQQQSYGNQAPMMPMPQQQQQQQMQPGGNIKHENGYYKRVTNSDLKPMSSHRPGDSIPEAKKVKKARYDMGQQNPTTKVVSLRNIPNDITDLQIVLIGLQFGDVVNILYIKGKGQALIDFTNVNEAIEMVQFFQHVPDHCNLKSIEAAHSSYQQLTIDNNRAAQTISTIQTAKQIKEAAMHGGDGCVIKALVSNLVYPICIEALYQIFSKYGNVLKIVIIQKNEYGALIQMKDEIQVQQAITNLNGRSMYNTYAGGCNVLSLQISRHKTIDVKSNTNKSWDYTNPLLPVVEQRMGNGNNDGHGNAHHNMMGQNMGQNSNMNKNNMMSEHPLLPMPMNMAAATMTAAMAAAAAAASGHHFNNSQSPFMSGHSHHQPHHGQHQHQNPAVQNGQGNSNNNPYAAAAVAAQSGYPPMPPMDGRSAVVQVSNFPDQIANPDALFTLFGVYGDILKVKIMYNRRDNALMQFKTYDQALNAVSNMNQVKLFDKIVSVQFSKFPEIQIPIKNDGGLAKDYSTSPLHRFKKPGSKNFYNIFAPNATLHLSNIAQVTSQDQIQELFSKYGSIMNFKWINKEGNRMALIELSSLEDSVMALIALHNYQLNGSYLRVNFAK